MAFTDELKVAAGDQWQRIVNHKFTIELAAGTIHNSVLKKYLIQDHRFLDAFVVLLSSMISSARSFEDRIPGCQFLALITGKESTYFERSFEKLGCADPDKRMAIPDDKCTTSLIELMKTVAKEGSLGEKLAVLCVCEWSYLEWAEAKTVTTEDKLYVEWINLHRGEYFARVVGYLRKLLDKEGKILSTLELELCKKRFLQTVQLEEDFFDSAYT